MLAIGRALMSRPRLLMLDEPSLGLAPLLVKEIFRIIEELNREANTIFLVEQNARMALEVAHFGYVLENGRVVLIDDVMFTGRTIRAARRSFSIRRTACRILPIPPPSGFDHLGHRRPCLFFGVDLLGEVPQSLGVFTDLRAEPRSQGKVVEHELIRLGEQLVPAGTHMLPEPFFVVECPIASFLVEGGETPRSRLGRKIAWQRS